MVESGTHAELLAGGRAATRRCGPCKTAGAERGRHEAGGGGGQGCSGRSLGLVLLLLGFAGFFTLRGHVRRTTRWCLRSRDAQRVAARRLPRAHRRARTGAGRWRRWPRRAKAGPQLRGAHGPQRLRRRASLSSCEGVLMVPAVEISTASGHLVAFGMQRRWRARVREEGVSAVEDAGGISVLAHPVQQRNPWTDPEAARRAEGLRAVLGGHLLPRGAQQPVLDG